MSRLLVIHGAGMETRGIDRIEVFGTMKMADYTDAIQGYASELGVEIEVFHSPEIEPLLARLQTCKEAGIDGILINPANLTVGNTAVGDAIRASGVPTIEVHVSNPAGRGVVSSIAPGTTGVVTGFGVASYRVAMAGLRDMLARPMR